MGPVKTEAAEMKTLMDAHVPYEAFWEGFIDHQHGQHQNPYSDLKNQVDAAQAWNSGQEAARRAAAIGR
ncbi:MAG: hypothetical protein R3D52_01110 [Xanthobacteraceae bacterium]